METSILLVEQQMTLIKNVAYLAANGVYHEDKMRFILTRAVSHMSCLGGTEESASKKLLGLAIEKELSHLHIQNPRYEEALRCALHDLMTLPPILV